MLCAEYQDREKLKRDIRESEGMEWTFENDFSVWALDHLWNRDVRFWFQDKNPPLVGISFFGTSKIDEKLFLETLEQLDKGLFMTVQFINIIATEADRLSYHSDSFQIPDDALGYFDFEASRIFLLLPAIRRLAMEQYKEQSPFVTFPQLASRAFWKTLLQQLRKAHQKILYLRKNSSASIWMKTRKNMRIKYTVTAITLFPKWFFKRRGSSSSFYIGDTNNPT